MPDNDWRERADLGISEWYDPEGDTYYVTFNTGEPSYCVETNDVLLIEVGIFSGLPTGFRVLNLHKPDAPKMALEAARALAVEVRKQADTRANERTAEFGRALEKVLVPA